MTKLGPILFGILLLPVVLVGESFRCDWGVNGIGGNMTSSAFKCGVTAGQTAAGLITGSNYWALIGYWLPEEQGGGVREQAYSPSPGRLVTRLFAPQPNPGRGPAEIRYSLAAQLQTTLQVSDLTGRVLRTLISSVQTPGRYSVRWDGRDSRGRLLAHGIYFCSLAAGGQRFIQKVVLTE
jgi:hypothetical protein